jgi:hypothetical protein
MIRHPSGACARVALWTADFGVRLLTLRWSVPHHYEWQDVPVWPAERMRLSDTAVGDCLAYDCGAIVVHRVGEYFRFLNGDPYLSLSQRSQYLYCAIAAL